MKTAVIISGQARTFDLCYPSQYWQVYRHYEPDLHFFVSVKDDEDADKMDVLRERHKNVSIQKLPDPEAFFMPDPDSGRFAPYANAAPIRNLMLQHRGNKEAFDFAWPNADSGTFDTIIRSRTDIFFHSFNKPIDVMNREVFTPWWGRFGGINDRFAIMDGYAANVYFNAYDRIPDLLEHGCPFHPETLVYESLKAGKIMVHRNLHTTFSTVRKDNKIRPPEIMLEDLADLSA